MISYLYGKVIETIRSNNNRVSLILEVNQIGYEIQIPGRLARNLPEDRSQQVKIFTHLQIRDDRTILYGFATGAERDLFCQLVSVSGVGCQTAIACIDTLGLSDLVQAIVTSNINVLSKVPGVGKKTAERIALELRTKLAQWREVAGVTVSNNNNAVSPPAEVQEDLEMTLLALGYTNQEIQQAISVLTKDNLMLKNRNSEDWIAGAIAWLSME